nr:TlpA disulfide reductase family protein [uncultured Carboxylicivirga sp.]
MKTIAIYLLVLIYPCLIFSQKITNLRVILPDNIDLSQLSISFNNGINTRDLQNLINNNIIEINDTIWSRYGTLSCAYPDSTSTNGIPNYDYWITEGENVVDFNVKSRFQNAFSQAILENALSVRNEGYGRYLSYIEVLNNSLSKFYLNNYSKFDSHPDLLDFFLCKQDSFTNKGLEFLRTNSNEYISLWIFQREYASTRRNSAKFDLQFFSTIFPDSLKKTFIGKKTLSIIKARMGSRIGQEAPDFTVLDSNNNVIQLYKYRGNYVLLDFWASWCNPCMKSMPKIKMMQNQYLNDNLKVISISVDDNPKNYNKALKEIGNIEDWSFVNDESISDVYGVSPIPQVILIDKNGIIIYNLEDMDDYSLTQLENLLKNLSK